jgi:rhamnulokinase
MWLLERSRKEFKNAPENVNVLNASAMEAPAFRSFIFPDAPEFANPTSMIEAIQTYCKKTGQPVPETHQEIARCIFESLAMRYRQVIGYLNDLAPFAIERLHVIGGGVWNTFLMQFAANATGLEVVTGPIEGTAIGNIMMQAKAAGVVDDMFEMRKIIANSIEQKTYQPQDKEAWDKAYERYLEVTKS